MNNNVRCECDVGANKDLEIIEDDNRSFGSLDIYKCCDFVASSKGDLEIVKDVNESFNFLGC